MNLHITTPFGRRSLTAAQVRAQANADGCPRETTVRKWTVLRDITEARAALGLTMPALVVLDALASFLPETALQIGEGAELVVFPSNRALMPRAKGMSEPTIRRHLAALVEAGVVIRRDSPNGKRYCRRGPGGQVAQAYGFDLASLVARASEFAALAETVRAETRALRVARERVTLLRRDCVKSIQALEEAEGAPGAAESLRGRYSATLGALPRVPALADLDRASDALIHLAADVTKLLLAHQENTESSGNPDQDERHKQNSNPDALDYEPASKLEEEEAAAIKPVRSRGTEAGRADEGRPQPAVSAPTNSPQVQTRSTYPLGLVLDACPDIRDYARGGINSWRDLVDTAELVRSMLGISPHAWEEAQTVMGGDAAAVMVAAILQRAEKITSPGGYLRALVERKKRGEFSLGPVLQALSRGQLKPSVATSQRRAR